jgi:prepilin-type N-terminal cleavage/methylation domain-containing protein/prepilin-type processing-associated H-X9-DG protein
VVASLTLRSPHAFPQSSLRARQAFTLIELLVVVAIIAVLIGLLLVAVQKAREAGARSSCENNLKQFGLALHGFTNDFGFMPPGVITVSDLQDSYHTGFTYLMPYIEQDGIFRQYDFTQPWYQTDNYAPVACTPDIFFCPSNRGKSQMDLSIYAQQWAGSAMPPVVGATDYVLCKGANAGLYFDPSLIPAQARGIFNITVFAEGALTGEVVASPAPQFQVSIASITDGLSSTIVIGEGAGGNPNFLVANINSPSQPVIAEFTAQPALMDQAWSASSFNAVAMPWTAGIFGVTAQFGLAPSPNDEPMNRRPGMPTTLGYDSSGYNLSGNDRVSGFRSMHPGGCQFLFADGSVHFLLQSIDPTVFRALSTYSGGEVNINY